jgi:5-methylcytosine-specific restriction enzyme A
MPDKRLYDSVRWRKARKAFLSREENVLCVDCLKRDKLSAATDVDHIVPHGGNMALFWSEANWQPLCHACHSRKTATGDGGFGISPIAKARQDCGMDGVPIDKRHPWNR